MKYFDTCNGIVYTIKNGDTLYAISGRFNVPLAVILRANPRVDIYNLQQGDQLCIPIAGGRFPITIIPYVINNPDSLLSILEQFGIDLTDFLRYNNLSDIKLEPGMTVQIPMNDQGEYTNMNMNMNE